MSVKSTKSTLTSRTNWAKLRQKSDKDIDYSEIPATDAKFWEEAVVVMPQAKTHLSVRFDKDVVTYFKRDGRGYQSRMNAVLRGYMDGHKKMLFDTKRKAHSR